MSDHGRVIGEPRLLNGDDPDALTRIRADANAIGARVIKWSGMVTARGCGWCSDGVILMSAARIKAGVLRDRLQTLPHYNVKDPAWMWRETSSASAKRIFDDADRNAIVEVVPIGWAKATRTMDRCLLVKGGGVDFDIVETAIDLLAESCTLTMHPSGAVFGLRCGGVLAAVVAGVKLEEAIGDGHRHG